jgi:hypothetical protein
MRRRNGGGDPKRKEEKLDIITANTNKENDIKMSYINREENKKIKY